MSTLKLENIKHENSSSNNLVLDSDGNVIIGTGSDIGSKLSVNSQASFGTDNNNRGIIDYSSNVLSMGTIQSGTANFSTVNVTGGSVGIGTNSPTDAAWFTANGDNSELALDGGTGYGVMHFRGTGAGSTDTRYSQGVGDSKFYMAWDALANAHRMTIEPSGVITTPTQPAFRVGTSGSSDITTQVVIGYDTEHHDRNNNFNTSTHRFTAPVNGVYQFTTYHWHKTGTSGVTHLYLYVNGTNNFEFRNTRASSHGEYNRIGFTTTVELSANDYVYIEGAGTSGGQLHTSAGVAYSQFSGYLIG